MPYVAPGYWAAGFAAGESSTGTAVTNVGGLAAGAAFGASSIASGIADPSEAFVAGVGAILSEEGFGASSVEAGVSGGGVDSARASDVWNYVLPSGKTAAQTLQETHDFVHALARIHGLVIGEPLRVAQAYRTAGPIQQSFSEAGGEVVVTRTA